MECSFMEWLSVTPASIINILKVIWVSCKRNCVKTCTYRKKMSVKTELVVEDSPFLINQDLLTGKKAPSTAVTASPF